MDSQLRMDIFPRSLSESIERLNYPTENFEDFKNDGTCNVFLQYLDQQSSKVYSYKLDWTEQYSSHMNNVGKGSLHFRKFYPEKIDWTKVANRLIKPTSQKLKKNSDNRIGFKNGNRFLVKVYFTFGQRTVKEGTVHVVQTLNVPLVFYLMKNVRRGICTDKRLKIKDGLLPYNYMNLYDRRVLSPNGCYRIPPGTTYILLSTQKNFFSVDIFPADAQIPLDHVEDPVAQRVIKIPDVYDRPVETPYMEDVVEEERIRKLDNLFESIRSPFKRPSSPSIFDSQQELPFKRPFIQPSQQSFKRPSSPSIFDSHQEPPFKRPFIQPPQPSFIQPPADYPEQREFSFEQPFIQPPADYPEQQEFSFEQPFIQPPADPKQQEFSFEQPFIQPPADPKQQEFSFEQPFIQPPADPKQQESLEKPFIQSFDDFIQLFDDNELKSLIPESDPYPIYSRPVVVAHPDCVTYYQRFLKKTELPSPIDNDFIISAMNDEPPLDLSLNGDIFPLDCKLNYDFEGLLSEFPFDF